MTPDNEAIAQRRRAVQALGQALYEGSDPGGVPWARRSPVVRDAWLLRAEQQISAARDPSDARPAGAVKIPGKQR